MIEKTYTDTEEVPIIADREVKRFTAYTIEGKAVELCAFVHRQKLPRELPDGFCYMGGVARSIVLQAMGENVPPYRDEDVVAILEFDPNTDNNFIDELSAKIMQEDYKNGHKILIERMGDYFAERDFTFNEILIYKGIVIATPQAVEDLRTKTVRPTEYERWKWRRHEHQSNGLKPKLVVKALRLAEQFMQIYDEGRIEGIEDWEFEIEGIPLFELALQLDKAFEQGDKIAERFFLGLLKAGTIKFRGEYSEPGAMNSNNPRELAQRLRLGMIGNGREPFLFEKDSLNKYNELTDDETVVGNEAFDRAVGMAEDYMRSKNATKLGIGDYLAKKG